VEGSLGFTDNNAAFQPTKVIINIIGKFPRKNQVYLTYMRCPLSYIWGRALPIEFTNLRLGGYNMDMIRVSATSRTSAVAGAIAGVVRDHKHAEVQAIGAGAVNQAIKALVLATGYLKLDGIDVACTPEFADVTIDDKVRTAIKLIIDPQ
jgi:stage V sporulation protein S